MNEFKDDLGLRVDKVDAQNQELRQQVVDAERAYELGHIDADDRPSDAHFYLMTKEQLEKSARFQNYMAHWGMLDDDVEDFATLGEKGLDRMRTALECRERDAAGSCRQDHSTGGAAAPA